MAPGRLGVLAHLALVANAVLIPSNLLGDDVSLETLAINPFKRSVSIECPGCAVAVQGEGEQLGWSEETGNTFVLEFETGPSEDSLYVDGDFQLYPPTFAYFSKPFNVVQLGPSGQDSLNLRVTGYKFHFSGAETISEAGMELLPMTLEITSIEGQHMSPPALTINVLKDTEGRLMIASFQPTQGSEPDAAPEDESCNEWPLLCKWKQAMSDRLRKMGNGCHKRPHGHHNPMEEETLEGKPPHRFRPGRPHRGAHHRPHYHKHEGGHHHGHHRFHMFLRRAFFTILVPVLVGIFAGTLTYLVGMALGCLIAMAISRFRGQEYERIVLVEDEEEFADERGEKEGFAELPAYDAPPVYEEESKKDEEQK